MEMRQVYTIGYSGFGNETRPFIDELKKRKIDVVIDVRSNPYSAQFNKFNETFLSHELSVNGITYRNYHEEFGAKQLNRNYYSKFDGEDLRIDYDIFSKSDAFKQGVNKLITICKNKHTPVIMCSEKDPINCHRAIMISRYLAHEYDFNIIHIVPNTDDEPHAMFEKRLVESIKNDLRKKKKLNLIESEMKQALKDFESPSLFSNEASKAIVLNVDNYYRLVNSRIGWKLNEVLGY